MRLFDTHCHFETREPSEIAACVARAKAEGVERILAVGGSAELNAAAGVAAGLPGVACALGFDREQAVRCPSEAVASLFGSSSSAAPVALGEIGLDYHYSPETRADQMRLFSVQLEEAARRGLPVVIHTREAADDTLAILREIPSRGVIHCFTGTPDEAKAYLELGFYVSISGIVTFKAADNVRAAALAVPDDRILIETDSPFLAPVPLRGRPNEPAFVRHTCEFLAELRKMDAEAFAELTFANAERMLEGR